MLKKLYSSTFFIIFAIKTSDFMEIVIIFFLLGLAAGALAAFLWMHSQTRGLQAKGEQQAEDNRRLTTERDVLQSKLDSTTQFYERQMETLKTQHQEQMTDLKAQHQQQMAEQMQMIKAEMNAASEKILKERAEQLSTANEQQLSIILNPLRENIRQMKDAVEKSDRAQTVTMERLDASIKENLRQAQEVGERADRLAQALTSENKTQGNFGELRLKQLLEEMGLEEGLQFEEQTALRDEQGRAIHDEDEGRRLIPDVILHFPDQRDVIIDSKISFTAFQDYYAARTDEERDQALRRHVASVRQHVSELSRKNYSRYIREGRQRLDFVMMYVFSESALQLALGSDPGLWREAYDRGVVIVGSQSLFVMLRVLEMSWKQMRQVENQQEIMKAASQVVDRVQQFYERFLRVDEQLHKTGEAFEDLKRSTQTSGMSITTAAQKLLRYGAQENPKRRQRLPRTEGGDEAMQALGEADGEEKK